MSGGQVQLTDANGLPLAVNSTTRVLKSEIALDYKGLYPESYYSTSTSLTGTADNAVLATLLDVTNYKGLIVENITGSANPIDFLVSLDGTNYLASTPAFLIYDATAVGTYVLTLPVGKACFLPLHYKSVQILQNGVTVGNTTCRYSLVGTMA